jgi:hydrogenase maturation protein HypF
LKLKTRSWTARSAGVEAGSWKPEDTLEPDPQAAPEKLRRLRVEIHGAVQGVGFRPFVYRLAAELGLHGWVINDTEGVFIEVEGAEAALARFLDRLPAETPPRAIVQSLSSAWLPLIGYTQFEIRHSDSSGAKTALILPDVATCPDCLAELLDPDNRRHRYPFTNCTNCGPRFSIIEALPYDRPNTTMRRFTMCPACQAEYDSPLDRRFHAQPNACPACGPHLALYENGKPLALAHADCSSPACKDDAALARAVELICAGKILAVKGLGGFHLMVDARNGPAVNRLRERKQRHEKPFAVMASDLDQVDLLCEVSAEAAALLTSAEAPIVLLGKRAGARSQESGDRGQGSGDRGQESGVRGQESGVRGQESGVRGQESGVRGQESGVRGQESGVGDQESEDRRQGAAGDKSSVSDPPSSFVLRRSSSIADEVAPDNPYLGVMLPYTPLHHLLLAELGFPVVATSGNLTDEPICTDEEDAFQRLGRIADAFLVHDRPIARHVDDSVAWILRGVPRLLRRARGYAPLPVLLGAEAPTILAVGAHLKNTVALSVGRQVFISQHIGDLETPEALAAFERVITDFLRMYEAAPVAVAHDLHPDYASTRYAQERFNVLTYQRANVPTCQRANVPTPVPVQHHHAHLAACLAENGTAGPALGVTWDGTGYGTDGTIWGGEFLLGDAAGFTRAAHLRPFRLLGGDAAVYEPRRVALALLCEIYGDAALVMDDLAPMRSFSISERHLLGRMLARGVNAPVTTSAGRLFDGIAALIGLNQEVSFEGQAAMALEFASSLREGGAYPLLLTTPQMTEGQDAPYVLDWQPMVEAILADLRAGVEQGIIAARFHGALVNAIEAVAVKVDEPRVALTGGCFQNRLLTQRAADRLERTGFEVLLHRLVPPNDGGISLGQVAVAAAQLRT